MEKINAKIKCLLISFGLTKFKKWDINYEGIEEHGKILTLEEETAAMLDFYFPDDWEVHWRDTEQYFGRCSLGKKMIFLSLPFARQTTFEGTCLTMLHEIAHALSPQQGHGKIWKDICVQIGGTGEQFGRIRRDRLIPEVTRKLYVA